MIARSLGSAPSVDLPSRISLVGSDNSGQAEVAREDRRLVKFGSPKLISSHLVTDGAVVAAVGDVGESLSAPRPSAKIAVASPTGIVDCTMTTNSGRSSQPMDLGTTPIAAGTRTSVEVTG